MQIEPSLNFEKFENKISQIKNEIIDGNTYQINFTFDNSFLLPQRFPLLILKRYIAFIVTTARFLIHARFDCYSPFIKHCVTGVHAERLETATESH